MSRIETLNEKENEKRENCEQKRKRKEEKIVSKKSTGDSIQFGEKPSRETDDGQFERVAKIIRGQSNASRGGGYTEQGGVELMSVGENSYRKRGRPGTASAT